MQFKTTALYLALAAAPLTSALGINCRGSAGCSAGTDPNTSKMLRDKLNAVPDRTFTNGQQIVCVFPKVSIQSRTGYLLHPVPCGIVLMCHRQFVLSSRIPMVPRPQHRLEYGLSRLWIMVAT